MFRKTKQTNKKTLQQNQRNAHHENFIIVKIAQNRLRQNKHHKKPFFLSFILIE